MPGRYVRTTPWEELSALLGDAPLGDASLLQPRHNIAPTQQIVVVVRDGETFRVDEMHWGARTGRLLMLEPNARSETYLKPGNDFWSRFRRCAIPASGYYEWKPIGRSKQPNFIHLKDGASFFFAGLHVVEDAGDGMPPAKVVAVTTEPNELVRPIHHRMGVILTRENVARWLDPDAEPEDLRDLLVPFPAELMEAWPVAVRVRNTRNDDERLIRPVKEKVEVNRYRAMQERDQKRRKGAGARSDDRSTPSD